ncbi:MAG TPA: FAD-dependent oxidoreductase [Polyangiaceae bacterium]|jgi:CDP-4-dehydro-6-deoxyglucose reductase
MARRRKAEIVAATMLSPSVRSLRMRLADGAAVGHTAGQYVDVIVPTARGLAFKRSYSIASEPGGARADELEIAVTRVEGGPTSEALHEATPGARVELEGPRGTFVRREGERDRPGLFIATGTGLAPIRAILAEEVQRRDGPPIALLFGCRTPDDVLWGDTLTAWAEVCPRFSLHVTLSRPPPDWRGATGHVQRHAAALAAALGDPAGLDAYVCGLSPMVDDVVSLLAREARVPRAGIHLETYD